MRSFQVIENKFIDIPRHYRGMGFDDFKTPYQKQKRTLRIAKEFVRTFHKQLERGANLIFTGGHGSGKTMLSLIICQALIQYNYSVGYYPNLHFLREIAEKKAESGMAFQAILDRYKRPLLLVLDQVTEGFMTGGRLSSLERFLLSCLIDARHHDKSTTILITHLDQKEMRNQLGSTVMSHLSHGVMLPFSGNYRMRQTKNNNWLKSYEKL